MSHPNGANSSSRSALSSHNAVNGLEGHIETQSTDQGDLLLRDVGSASSLGSAASSVFSHNSTQHRNPSLNHGLTPLTNHTELSPIKGNSPLPVKENTAMTNVNGDSLSFDMATSAANATASHPQRQRVSMLPPSGQVKGYRAVWDPELDGKLSKEERKRATMRKREFGAETYEPDPPPDPRLAIPSYIAGHCRPTNRPSKAIWRLAPYNIPPYKINDRHSIGPGEAQQVMVMGFDPFLPESTLRLNFSTFGTIASLQNKTDPETGSFLGIALVKYRDGMRDGVEWTAANAAKRAESEFNGARIGQSVIRVELDREGRRCKRQVEAVLKRAREVRAKEMGAIPPPPAKPVRAAANDSPAPPLNAPKGPSGKPAVKPPEGPRTTTAAAAAAAAAAAGAAVPAKTAAASLIEEEPVLGKIKRKPYIFIPHSAVPVLGTTIPHLKKRLKSYDWREVRLDSTGYYVIFDDSKRGEDETERCFNECNDAALFTYKMTMECQKYGNPDYERSPSPERVLQEQKTRAEIERLEREEAEDVEIEKKNRAENLDPVLGALEQLRVELLDKIMSDIKTRIAIPIFHESLDPTKHVARRRKLGLPDPLDNENKPSTLLYNKAGEFPSSKSRYGQSLSQSKPLRPHDKRGKKGGRERESGNAYIDERRRRLPPQRPSHARGLHFRLQQMFADEEEDSDEERQASVTRGDTEDLESRPLSRASRNSTPADTESVPDTPKHKRRKVSEWEDEEKETFTTFHKEMLGHLLHKEPEDLATRELELVVNTLPRTSKYATRARTELFIRQRSKADDDLFQVDVKKEPGDDSAVLRDAQASSKDSKEKAKKKRKTKKQILEEQELKSEQKKSKEPSQPTVTETATPVEEKEAEVEVEDEEEDKEYETSFTFDKPRRTVEDDRSVTVLDIDGWQHLIKDDEDLAFARQVFAEEPEHDIPNVALWAYKQKEIKALNSAVSGDAAPGALIQGYYVPNSTGCARTEGVKKILNEEKSKYLPHRIKVQKAREERQAFAKANPGAAPEASKITAAEKIAGTAASRSNRANNRRLVNDINLHKQSLAAANSDADVTIRFNQLKKRKKLVKFDRSAIHGWGLYAEENIAINDLIIEYVGEKVRQKVADMRELRYEKQGVGSSYLFRMMDDEIVDATKKGGIARFINHSCNPNCTAKIIKVEGTPRIVIYALKEIYKNEELTYDYKFEREFESNDRIPCLCGSANCKGFLN